MVFDAVELKQYADFLYDFEFKNDVVVDFQTLKDLTQACANLFCGHYTTTEYMQRNLILFGNHRELEKRFRKYSETVVEIAKKINDCKEHQNPVEVKTLEECLDRTTANLFNGREAMVHVYYQEFVNDPELQSTLVKPRMQDFYVPIAEDDMKNKQKLLRYYTATCRRRKYRKLYGKEMLFSPKFTQEGHYTYHFEMDCEMKRFLYDAIYPYSQHTTLYSWLTSSNTKDLIDHLAYCVDDDLPELKKCRWLFSYRNGVFDALQNKFFPYQHDPDYPHDASQIDSSLVTCNYLDYEFRYKEYDDCIAADGDPYDIPTPSCQKILDCQGFPKEVCRWSYASIGRLIFEVGQLDNWQYFPFYKGVAGSGKSTLLNLASFFFASIDVGTMMSEGQRNFSVEHLYDKYVFFCMDTDQKMTLSQTRWNQMVSGERMSIERKFKIPLELFWKVTGAFAGNCYPPWVDQAGNVSRRLLLFLFEKAVREIDPNLMEKCKSEMPAFMKKCVSCYHQMVRLHGHKGIWDRGVLPPEFHRAKKLLQSCTNPLQALLMSDDRCVLGPEQTCTFRDLREAYLKYCKDSGVKSPPRLDMDFVENLFLSHGITVVRPSGDPGEPHTTKYLVGVGLVGFECA